MNSFARKIIIYCFLVLIVLVVLEFVFIYAELFKHAPHIGIGFHIVGGFAVAFAALYVFRSQLLLQKVYMQSMFMLGCVGLAAIGWEGFEWMYSFVLSSNSMQGSINNTMADLYVGLVGGLLACLVNYWKPIK